MGYRSNGWGQFEIKKLTDEQEKAFEVWLEDNEVEHDRSGNTINIMFSDWKISVAPEVFKELATYVDGFFEIKGEDWDDVWKMTLEGGKIFEHTLKTKCWNEKKEVWGD